MTAAPARPPASSVNALGISAKQLAQLEDRLRGRKPKSAGSIPANGRSVSSPDVLLGIDPSLRGTGFGVLTRVGGELNSQAHGTIKCPPAWPGSRCLARISEVLREVVRKHSPTVCVVEGLFYAQNMRTALIMGQARGAALSVVAEAGIEIYELAPRRVKQAIVGYGAASKHAVARMIQRQLNLAEQPEPDAADALAVALAYTQSQGRLSVTQLKQI
ncbi:crossover junction endodeoxyribonuclease RuvC [bacterium]|nr:crossover junction endodeoxyribonuclease RuvC [bacterium]